MIRGFPKAQKVTNPVASAKKILDWYNQNRGSIQVGRAMPRQDVRDMNNLIESIQWLEKKQGKTQLEKEKLLRWRSMLKSVVFDASAEMTRLKLSK